MAKAQDTGKSVSKAASSTIDLFDASLTTELVGIRVFDVGQGDCIGLLDQRGDVFCYVDYGGLGDHPDLGSSLPNPAATRMPTGYGSGNTAIILTHWDKDHYFSAKKYNTDATKGLWLVPRQLASPQAVRFAAGLTHALCWPEACGNKTKSFHISADDSIQIRKCKRFDPTSPTEDRNASGLVVTLLREENGIPKFYMLLPGDRHFDGIPGLPAVEIRVLVAYHHGSHSDWTTATKAEITKLLGTPRDLVYSFGATNTYGHPDTSNYEKEWDPPAVKTPELRNCSKKFQDFKW